MKFYPKSSASLMWRNAPLARWIFPPRPFDACLLFDRCVGPNRRTQRLSYRAFASDRRGQRIEKICTARVQLLTCTKVICRWSVKSTTAFIRPTVGEPCTTEEACFGVQSILEFMTQPFMEGAALWSSMKKLRCRDNNVSGTLSSACFSESRDKKKGKKNFDLTLWGTSFILQQGYNFNVEKLIHYSCKLERYKFRNYKENRIDNAKPSPDTKSRTQLSF